MPDERRSWAHLYGGPEDGAEVEVEHTAGQPPLYVCVGNVQSPDADPQVGYYQRTDWVKDGGNALYYRWCGWDDEWD